jgi:hypothetical protein
MNQLTLEWIEAGQTRTQTIVDQQPDHHPGILRIGRDPTRCDLVLQHPSVSGLHVEIFFDQLQCGFYLRNLRDSNPPLVDYQRVTDRVVALRQGSKVCLGRVELKVTAIATAIPLTILLTPPSSSPRPGQPVVHPSVLPLPQSSMRQPHYGLLCSSCQQVSTYDQLILGCRWCGTSLAAAESILMTPETPH